MLQFHSSWPIWRSSLQCYLYLVGPPEDELLLRLQLSSVDRLVHSLTGDPSSSFVFGGYVCGKEHGDRHHRPSGVGVIFVIKNSSWAELYIYHIYMKHAPGYGESPGHQHFSSSYAWNWGPQELAYGYVPGANMQVNLSWYGGDGSRANCRNF